MPAHAGSDLLRLFCEYPFPALPLVEPGGDCAGVVRRRAVEAYAARGAAEPVAEFLAACRGTYFTPDEEAEVRGRQQREGRAVPLLAADGAIAGFWHHGPAPWEQPAASAAVPVTGLWPCALRYDGEGRVQQHSPLPRAWQQLAAVPRGWQLADLAWRLETARRTGVAHGYFRRAGRRYRFVLDAAADGGGICRVTPLFPVEELMEYLQEQALPLGELMDLCERELLQEVLAGCRDRAAAAALLGLPRQTLLYKLRKHGL